MKFSEARKQHKDNGKSQRMTKDEKRFLRRELINIYLRQGYFSGKRYSWSHLRTAIRREEIMLYFQSLKVYR